jgi:hypothetical protein
LVQEAGWGVKTMRPFHAPFHSFGPFSFTTASCLLVGGLLLLAGRRLFWIFVGAAGFFVGTGVAARIASGTADWVALVIALAFGLAGLVLSLIVQKLAIVAAGFVMGSYAVDRLLLTLQPRWAGWEWAALLAGGALGTLLVLLLFDWALIVLSSLGGAALIIYPFSPVPSLGLLLFAVLTIAGIGFQGGVLKKAKGGGRPKDGTRNPRGTPS